MTDDVTAESPDDPRARPATAGAASDPPSPADAGGASAATVGDAGAGRPPGTDAGEAPAAGEAEATAAAGPQAAQPGAAAGPEAAQPGATAGPEAAQPGAAAEPDAPPGPAAVEPGAAAQRDEYYDLLLRKTAEFDNYRKRVERERAALAAAAAADLLEELLPVVDNLERALDAQVDEGAAAAYRDGVELIHRQMLDLLRKRGVTPIETAGEDFDPNLHQAIAHEESVDHRAGEIVGEVRRGYMLGSRLLRAAMVRVAKA